MQGPELEDGAQAPLQDNFLDALPEAPARAYAWYQIFWLIYSSPEPDTLRSLLADPKAKLQRALIWVFVGSLVMGGFPFLLYWLSGGTIVHDDLGFLLPSRSLIYKQVHGPKRLGVPLDEVIPLVRGAIGAGLDAFFLEDVPDRLPADLLDAEFS